MSLGGTQFSPFPGSSHGKESACYAREPVQFLGWEDPLKKGKATHSSILGLENSMDWGVWQATVHGVAKSWTGLGDFQTHTSSHLGIKIHMSTLCSRTANLRGFLLSAQGFVRTIFKILKAIFFKGLIKSLHFLHTKSRLCMSKKPILTLISRASHSFH